MAEYEKLTFADLRPHFDVSRSYTQKQGTKKTTITVSYVKTSAGEIERSQWQSLVWNLIQESGEEDLFSSLLEWVTAHVAWLRSEAERRNYALELHATRVFDDPLWVDFVPFNQKYRPSCLADAELESVVPDCCKVEGITTLAQIEAGDGRVCCPRCGRFSTYTRRSAEDEHRKEEC